MEDAGWPSKNLTPYEQNNPEHVKEMIATGKQDGWKLAPENIGGTRSVATPAPKGAPKFEPGNAERGTMMYRDGDKSKPVMISVARVKGPNGEKMARVSAVERRPSSPQGWGLRGNYAIERNRLQRAEGVRDLLAGKRNQRVRADEIFGKK